MYTTLARVETGHVIRFCNTGSIGLVLRSENLMGLVWVNLDKPRICWPINHVNSDSLVKDLGPLSNFINLGHFFNKCHEI